MGILHLLLPLKVGLFPVQERGDLKVWGASKFSRRCVTFLMGVLAGIPAFRSDYTYLMVCHYPFTQLRGKSQCGAKLLV